MTANAPTRLSQLRAASLAMLDELTPAQLRAQSHAELSPMLWHVGHVFFAETYWIAERVFGDTTVTDAWCDLYFPEICPKKTRGSRLPDANALREWARDVSARNDHYWRQAADLAHPLLENGYLAAFVRQHYAQHLETMRLARTQLRYAAVGTRSTRAVTARAPDGDRIQIDTHRAMIGTAGIDAYDNEQPCFTIEVPIFAIARRCVSNAEWLGFIEAGGYDAQHLWDDDGWAWRCHHDVQHPEHWRCIGATDWHIPSDDDTASAETPVHGIGWYEARAFARYAGARLPREIEWEAAARASMLGDGHRVWEWCDDAFYPYPGFNAFPYDGYSRPWFDGAHFIARGASRHTEADIRRPGFRNFYPPTHRHVFAGLRLAW